MRTPAFGGGRWISPGVCILIALAVWLVFGQTLRHGFVNYDDDQYVFNNPMVKKGLTWEGVGWAFTHGEIGHWHPLTWLSHMLDCQLYGLNAGGHHLTSVLFHAVAAMLLFLVLRQMTGSRWRSAFVAALFALHPLRVESVAWVSERKDVLGAFFFMLTLGAYVRYVRRPSGGRYAAVAGLFALGLLSKNMLVTLPFVLLLLDYWPLNRMRSAGRGVQNAWTGNPQSSTFDLQPSTLRRLVWEKVPLLVLSVASCVVTLLVPEELSPLRRLPFALRVENALVSCVVYLRQLVWPTGLNCLYPNPVHGLPLWEVLLALALLLALSVVVVFFRRRHPCLLVGWLWYLGMLLPVLGFIQISFYAHADRYTYLPQIGIYLLVTWLVAELSARWRFRRPVLGLMMAVIILVLMICSRRQTACWRDSDTLWTRALACNSNNSIAHNNLGAVRYAAGRVDEGMLHFREAVRINPKYTAAQHNLGSLLLSAGQVTAAIGHLKTAVELDPRKVNSHIRLGVALLQSGEVKEAVAHFEQALAVDPNQELANENLAWILATCPDASLRNGVRALALAETANRLSGGTNTSILQTLSAACAENGQFTRAVATARQALTLAEARNDTALADSLRALIQSYEAGKPFRDVSQTNKAVHPN